VNAYLFDEVLLSFESVEETHLGSVSRTHDAAFSPIKMCRDSVESWKILQEEKNPPKGSKETPAPPQPHIAWITTGLPPVRDVDFQFGHGWLTSQEDPGKIRTLGAPIANVYLFTPSWSEVPL
jgi:hypothetical protein